MRKIYLTSIFILISMVSFAQKGIIRGKVTDDNKLPLPGAIISIDNKKTLTDFNGNYIILGLENGKHTLGTSYLGYKTETKEVALDNKAVVINFVLTSDVNSLNEVVIKGSIGSGQAKALNKQKNNMNVTNVIAADQVGKFPDSNIGDAIKRVPGIAVQNDQGEARNIIVRGLATQLNSVTINGERIPSAEAENRNVQLDLIPSDMVQAVEVNKVLTPAMEGDAIGGSVNLVTRTAVGRRITATLGYGQSPIRETPIYNAAIVVSDRFFNNKLGAIVTASIQRNEFGSDNIEFEWDKSDLNGTYVAEHDIRRYDLTRQRESVALNLDYKFNDKNKIYFNGVYNTRNDWENRYRLRFKNDETDVAGIYETEVRRQTKGGLKKDSRLEKQQVQSYAINGEHIFNNDIKFDWKGSYSKASEERPDERYISYRQKDLEFRQNLNNTKSPYMIPANGDYNDLSLFELREITDENQYTAEENYSFKADLEYPVLDNLTLKAGYKFQLKDKLRNNDFSEYEPTSDLANVPFSDQTLSDFEPGKRYASGNFVTKEYLTSLDLQNSTLFEKSDVEDEYLPGNYNAEENINSFYGMATLEVDEHFTVLGGLRVEKTSIDYTGYRFDAEGNAETVKINDSQDYTNWLPNLQFKYNVDNTVVRLAYSNSIARPNYFDLVPYQYLNSDDFEFEEGNPNLDPTKSMNFDLMVEQYFSSVGIFSVGFFHKTLNDFIFTYREDGYVDAGFPGETFEYSQSRNGDKATVYGIEASLQTKLGFIHDKLNNFNLYLNYTNTNSNATGVEGRDDENLDLAGAVNHMFNSSLAYETKKLTLRASLNYAGDYIDEYGGDSFEDRYYGSQTFVDLNGNYEVAKGLRLFADVKNLTNQSLKYYQGSEDFTMQNEYYGIMWNVGVKYNF